MLKKSQIFSFLITFTVTFVLGFFVWSVFVDFPGNFVKSNIFSASMQPDYIFEDLVPAETSEENFEPDLVKDENSTIPVIQNEVLAPAESIRDQLDDIQEKLDIISQQVQELVAQQDNNNQLAQEVEDVLPEDEGDYEPQVSVPTEQDIIYTEPTPPIGGGSPTLIVYPKILISEVQIAPIDQRFVELYNPNSTDVDLTNWYLQRRTVSGSGYTSFITKSDFSGKKISANSYFLISKSDAITDIRMDNMPITDNNSFAFKNPNGEISDKLGFSSALDFELLATTSPSTGQSIGRKVLEDGSEQDTDSNLADFELQTPTPRAQNITYTAPEEPASPTLASIAITTPATKLSYIVGDVLDITGLVVTGTYSDNSTQNEAVTLENITGFDSSVAIDSQLLVINFQGQTTTYLINIIEPVVVENILINRIQIDPIEQRFVELYNPNSADIDLTDWYLQRKTQNADSWSSFVSSTNFGGKIILANGYLLISRQLPDSDILINITLSDSNSLALKNPNRDIIDKIGWGSAIDFETAPALNPVEFEILTRTAGIDTDNNSLDFSIVNTTSPSNL